MSDTHNKALISEAEIIFEKTTLQEHMFFGKCHDLYLKIDGVKNEHLCAMSAQSPIMKHSMKVLKELTGSKTLKDLNHKKVRVIYKIDGSTVLPYYLGDLKENKFIPVNGFALAPLIYESCCEDVDMDIYLVPPKQKIQVGAYKEQVEYDPYLTVLAPYLGSVEI